MNTLLPTRKGIYIFEDDGKSFFTSFPIYSIKNLPNLKNRSIVMGFVGPNGSGKSVNAGRELAVGYMIKGVDVYSNMRIAFNQVLPSGELIIRQTIDIDNMEMRNLDTKYANCAVYYDEVNVSVAEARRSMSDVNLKVMYIVQQKRKRNLDVIWSAVSEMDVDVRLRSRTDIFVKCGDLSLRPGFQHNGVGTFSEMTYYDYGGLVVPNDYGMGEKSVFNRMVVNNRPWWNIYDTYQLQMPDSVNQVEENDELENQADELALKIVSLIYDSADGKVRLHNLWRNLNVTEHKLKIKVGQKLREYGVSTIGYNPTNRAYVIEEIAADF